MGVGRPAPALKVPAIQKRALGNGSSLAFSVSLPAVGDAQLDLLDVTGRRLESVDLSSMGVGEHTVKFSTLKRALRQDLKNAHRVHVMAAYFLPTWKLRRALQTVDVARQLLDGGLGRVESHDVMGGDQSGLDETASKSLGHLPGSDESNASGIHGGYPGAGSQCSVVRDSAVWEQYAAGAVGLSLDDLSSLARAFTRAW